MTDPIIPEPVPVVIPSTQKEVALTTAALLFAALGIVLLLLAFFWGLTSLFGSSNPTPLITPGPVSTHSATPAPTVTVTPSPGRNTPGQTTPGSTRIVVVPGPATTTTTKPGPQGSPGPQGPPGTPAPPAPVPTPEPCLNLNKLLPPGCKLL